MVETWVLVLWFNSSGSFIRVIEGYKSREQCAVAQKIIADATHKNGFSVMHTTCIPGPSK